MAAGFGMLHGLAHLPGLCGQGRQAGSGVSLLVILGNDVAGLVELWQVG